MRVVYESKIVHHFLPNSRFFKPLFGINKNTTNAISAYIISNPKTAIITPIEITAKREVFVFNMLSAAIDTKKYISTKTPFEYVISRSILKSNRNFKILTVKIIPIITKRTFLNPIFRVVERRVRDATYKFRAIMQIINATTAIILSA